MSEDLTVEPFEGPADGWNDLLGRFEGATFCHLYGWRRVMEDALGHQTHWWVAREPGGEIGGVLPLTRVRSRLFGDYLISMPFLNYGGPVGSPKAREALARRAAEEARTLGVDLLELRNRVELVAEPLERNQRKLTVVKTLPESSEDLWEDGLRSKVRSQVRRPMKEGMEVRDGAELLDPFYDVFSTTMRDLGTPVLSKGFFESIREHLSDAVVFMTVELEGEPLAAGCGLHWGGELEITWAGASRDHARLSPNMLLYWGMMEKAIELGLERFNFGRCTPDSGTHRFKRQWGTEDHPLPWLQWSESGIPSPPDPDSPKYRTAIDVWRRLPVGLTNRIGPPISRLLP
ncbi:MAG: FemAB family PEP-CTERM system-associated protein [Gemmatimonadetes bacterium]|nr:FemAB family PEP-CTERM system-associated protein [Gemmatimonadota bacterium]NNL30196.1 FemAB family PEP-CTERM system-associated protein [Gemmatimonadota bacterium]